MTIEIAGTSTWNKGAELMLIAIKEHFSVFPAPVKLVVDTYFGSFQDRAKHGLFLKSEITKWGRSKFALELMPPSYRKELGIIREKEIGIILDASGFAFGDQHAPERTIRFAKEAELAKKAGKKVILLPQAFGPFNTPVMKDGFRRIGRVADLIFARDKVSLEYAKDILNAHNNVHLAPDFTNLVKPVLHTNPESRKKVIIVPNQRMIEKANSKENAVGYIPLLQRCIELVQELNYIPEVLIHGKPDREIAKVLNKNMTSAVPVIEERDPVVIKRILGECKLVIGSRFHALVSSLSQAIPTIGTSWSHKYEMLFQDYHCGEMLLNPSGDNLEELIRKALGSENLTLVNNLQVRANHLSEATRGMWSIVDQEIGLKHE